MRQRWTVIREPRSLYDMPIFRWRGSAERFAARNTCQHITYTVVPYVPPCACGRTDCTSIELPTVPSAPAPGMEPPADTSWATFETPTRGPDRYDLGWGFSPPRKRRLWLQLLLGIGLITLLVFVILWWTP
jgi:hypothetical protein